MATAKTPRKRAKKKAVETGTLNVAFVWDMSGSMGRIEEATKEGTIQYLLDLQEEEAKLVEKNGPGAYTRLSLTIFDTVFEQWLVDESIADVDVREIVSRYRHRGGTALYDAIANTISSLESRLREQKREEEKCLVIVMTDGGENSSQEYGRYNNGKQRVFDMIKSYEDKGTWTFVYLGAGAEAYTESQNLGFAAGNVGTYDPTVASVAAASASYASMTRSVRSSDQGSTVTAFADAGTGNDFTNNNTNESEK